MADVADRARFFLEKAVPQLREFEEKEIFSREEIRTLVQKRTEFEHIIGAPGCKPDSFLSYIAWEQSLEKLRAMRCLRMKIKHSSNYAGHARVFNIYERAVIRHPGSRLLWRRYLDFAGAAKATKRWRKIMTRALRMHPTDPGFWVLAGRRAARDGDMDGARSMFLRGCRFCTRDETVWVEYARVEMEWLARAERKKGSKELVAVAVSHVAEDEGNIKFGDEEEDDKGEFGDELVLPDPVGDQAKEKSDMLSQEAMQKLEKSPALAGALPRAIFDVARKQEFFKPATAEAFFDMMATFSRLSAQPSLVQHVLDNMVEIAPNDPSTCNCQVRQPLISLDTATPAFPKALRESLAMLKTAVEKTEDKAALATKTTAWIDSILAKDDLDAGIRTVLEHTRRKLDNL